MSVMKLPFGHSVHHYHPSTNRGIQHKERLFSHARTEQRRSLRVKHPGIDAPCMVHL